MGTGELDPKFRIRAPLRCDGVGSLDCAEDTESGMRMAIRWLPVEANGEAAVKAVEEMPRHPALPRIRQTGRVGSAAYVAMDFPDGKLLGAMLDDTRLMVDQVAGMGAAIADALALLHAQGTVHGELSADSVLMLPDGKSILWDFPLVMANRITDRRGEERALARLIRVAPYLSPERARGLPPSAAADVYALGALMCIAAGGEMPAGATTLAVVHRIASGEWTPELPRSFSPAMRAIVGRMVDPDPLSRPTARECAQALSDLVQRTPTIPEMRAVVAPAPPSPSNAETNEAGNSGVRAANAVRAATKSGAGPVGESDPAGRGEDAAEKSGQRLVAAEAMTAAGAGARAGSFLASAKESDPRPSTPVSANSGSHWPQSEATTEVTASAVSVAPMRPAASAVLEAPWVSEAVATPTTSRQRTILVGGAIAVAAIIALGTAVALRGGKTTREQTPTGSELAPAPVLNVEAASPAQTGPHPDVSSLVAPLVDRTASASGPTRRSSPGPRPTARKAEISSGSLEAEAAAAPESSDPHDFSFLPTDAPAPTSELKRPNF